MALVMPIDSHNTMEWRDGRWRRRAVPLVPVWFLDDLDLGMSKDPTLSEVCRVLARDRDRADMYWPLVEALYP